MPIEPRQFRLFSILFLGVVGVLAALWFFVLRVEYVPIYENIREADASQIVTELDKSGIAYRLGNDGHDILVDKDQSAKARVAVAGADIPMGGTTGFELFNENELGLTEFAQKINLQRAIQGELARTIMIMDGVEFARVHLALPQRSLFRAEQEAPTAAVTVEMRPSRRLSQASSDGIRQLVASSVPGLTYANVALLDERGNLLSTSPVEEAAATDSVGTQREAIETFLKIRATDALKQVLPRQPFRIEVSAFEALASAAQSTQLETANATQDTPPTSAPTSAPPEERLMGLEGRALRVLVRTPQTLDEVEREIIRGTLTDALKLSAQSGDVLDFTTGALTPIAAQPSPAPQTDWTQPEPITMPASDAASNSWGSEWQNASLASPWLALPLAILVIVLLALRPRRRLSQVETEDFAALLRSSQLSGKES